eukprot:Sspe_Gene.82123::Locus_53754_Transcript_2_2_Confidence_0.667_Length_2119::g.82123::m.82123/K19612/PDE12; 2',5'-phosphodiesterase
MARAAEGTPLEQLEGINKALRNVACATLTAEDVNITLWLEGQKYGFKRGLSEQVGNTLLRMGRKLETPLLGPPTPKKKGKEEIKKEAPPPRLILTLEGSDEEAENRKGWPTASSIRIRPVAGGDERTLPVLVDPPEVVSLTMSDAVPLTEVPQLPAIATSNTTSTIVHWWSVDEAVGQGKKPVPFTLGDAKYVGTGAVYTPTEADVGRRLVATVIPMRDAVAGVPATSTPSGIVRKLPLPPEPRAPSTPPTRPEMRVVSYNILYDGATEDYSTGETLYSYVAKDALEQSYRSQVFLHEVYTFSPDILALQEVGASHLSSVLDPHLTMAGFEGDVAMKNGGSREGVATFWRRSAFRKIATKPVNLGGALPGSAPPEPDIPAPEPKKKKGKLDGGKAPAVRQHVLDVPDNAEDLVGFIQSHPKVEKIVAKVTTVGHLTALEAVDSGVVVVVINTHLWFHPRGGHVRCLQLALLLKHAEAFAASIPSSAPRRFLMCGDLNLLPGSAPHTYLVTGCVPATHPVWAAAHTFEWGRWDFAEGAVGAVEEGESIGGIELTHNFGFVDPHPDVECTNCTPGFQGRLDYILCGQGIEVATAYNPPSKESMTAEVGLPSHAYPSDHVPLVADIALQ